MFDNKKKIPLYREVLNPEVEKMLINRKTPGGITLEHIVRSGMENSDSSIGCYAGDGDSYETFAPLFDPVIAKYHGVKGEIDHGKRLISLERSADRPFDDHGLIISTRIRVGRNLTGYSFPSMISRRDRLALEEKVLGVLKGLPPETAGEYMGLGKMDEATRAGMVRDHLLFKKGDRFLESAGINRDWPEGRGIHISGDRRFLVWVNEEDHLRIIAMEEGGDIRGVFRRLVSGALYLEERLDVAFDERLGYLASCPTNLGTSMRASVHIRLPNLSKTETLPRICEELRLSVRGTDGEHSDVRGGIYDISNKQRLGISEEEIIQGLCSGIERLVSMETNF